MLGAFITIQFTTFCTKNLPFSQKYSIVWLTLKSYLGSHDREIIETEKRVLYHKETTKKVEECMYTHSVKNLFPFLSLSWLLFCAQSTDTP